MAEPNRLAARIVEIQVVVDAICDVELDPLLANLAEPLFNELVLIAPDMDAQIFGQVLPEIKPLVRRITLYASENDHALRLSRELHGYPRLGEGGELLTVYPGMEIIDVSSLPVQSPSGHVYHLYNTDVGRDIRQLLETGASASQRPGLIEDNKDGLEFWRLAPTEDR